MIDYVNETCDMRLASVHADGVPDAMAGAIASRIAAFVRPGPGARNGRDRRREGPYDSLRHAESEGEGKMKFRGMLIVVILALVVVYAVYFSKTGDKSNIKVMVDQYAEAKIDLTKVNLPSLERIVAERIASEGQAPADSQGAPAVPADGGVLPSTPGAGRSAMRSSPIRASG